MRSRCASTRSTWILTLSTRIACSVRRSCKSDPVSSAWLAHALGSAGHSRRAAEIVRILTERVGRDYVSAYHLALAQIGVGDTNRALASLETALTEHDPALISIGFEPRLEPLRSDPRFHALIERMGLRHGQS